MTGEQHASDAGAALEAIVGRGCVWHEAPLAPFTTMRVGGPAEWLVEPKSSDQLVALHRFARGAGLPLTLLGGGSNLVVGDRGIRGIVVRVRSGAIDEVAGGRVRADAGVTINGLVRWTIAHGLAGLEAWAGTPGTVGGAIYGNAHFQGRLIGDLVAHVRLLAPSGEIRDVPREEMAFGYDTSRLHDTREIVLSATFHATCGDPAALRRIARESLAFRKTTQPLQLPSAGCIFQNPDPARDRLPAGVPPSAGALIDRAGLKGRAIGAARVSPTHGNFIVNEGGATASDVRALVRLCQSAVQEQFGVLLKEEVVFAGDF